MGLPFPSVSEYFSDWRCSHTGNSFRHWTCELSQGRHIKKTSRVRTASRVRAGLFERRLFTGQKEEDELGKEAGTPGTADACARPIICILPFLADGFSHSPLGHGPQEACPSTTGSSGQKEAVFREGKLQTTHAHLVGLQRKHEHQPLYDIVKFKND